MDAATLHAMELTPARRRALRAKAHHLDPVVSIGNQGLTPAVLHEIDVNLLAHELVKLRVHSDDRNEREQVLARVCNELDAAPVQHLGKVLIVYRERKDEEAPAPVVRHAPAKRKSSSGAGKATTARSTPRERKRGAAAEAGAPSGKARKTPRARRRLG